MFPRDPGSPKGDRDERKRDDSPYAISAHPWEKNGFV